MPNTPYWEKALMLMQGDPSKMTRDELIEGQIVLVLTMKAAADEIVRLQEKCKRLGGDKNEY